MRCCRHRTWTGCCIYISVSKHGAVYCCCACFAPRLDGKCWSTLGCGSNPPTLSCACFYECNSIQPRAKLVADARLHHPIAVPRLPDELPPGSNKPSSFYCFDFLT